MICLKILFYTIFFLQERCFDFLECASPSQKIVSRTLVWGPLQPRASVEKFPGGTTKKIPKNSEKDRKNGTIKPVPGEATEKRPKNSKKHRKIAFLTLYLLNLYRVWKSRRGHGPPRCRHPWLQRDKKLKLLIQLQSSILFVLSAAVQNRNDNTAHWYSEFLLFQHSAHFTLNVFVYKFKFSGIVFNLS